jgi:hypothetical protein
MSVTLGWRGALCALGALGAFSAPTTPITPVSVAVGSCAAEAGEQNVVKMNDALSFLEC